MSSTRFKLACLTIAALGLATAIGVPTAAGADRTADERKLDAWWIDLEGEDEGAARALLKLAERPKEAVAFLKVKMKPLAIDAEKVKSLIEWLGNDDGAVWKSAFEELEYFDPRLAIDLEPLMKDVKQTPARQRMVEILSGREADSLRGKSIVFFTLGHGDFSFSASMFGSWWAVHKVDRLGYSDLGIPKKKWTRAIRAIVLLEHFGTPDAVAILKDMATGHPDARPTKAAKAALDRIAKAGRR